MTISEFTIKVIAKAKDILKQEKKLSKELAFEKALEIIVYETDFDFNKAQLVLKKLKSLAYLEKDNGKEVHYNDKR